MTISNTRQPRPRSAPAYLDIFFNKPELQARSEVGHEEQFAPPGPSGRHRFGEATFAGTDGNKRDAPFPDIHRYRIIGFVENPSGVHILGISGGGRPS
jgi:hypothetical protein